MSCRFPHVPPYPHVGACMRRLAETLAARDREAAAAHLAAKREWRERELLLLEVSRLRSELSGLNRQLTNSVNAAREQAEAAEQQVCSSVQDYPSLCGLCRCPACAPPSSITALNHHSAGAA